MARKSSTNAVKQLNKQMDKVKSTPRTKNKSSVGKVKENNSKSTLKKSTASTKKTDIRSKKNTREKIVVVNDSETVKNTKSVNKTKSDNVVREKIVVAKTNDKKIDDMNLVKDKVVVVSDTRKPKKTKTTTLEKTKDNVKDKIVIVEETPRVNIKKELTEGEKAKKLLNRKKKFEFLDVNNDDEKDKEVIASEIENDIINGKYIDKAKALINKSNNDKIKKIRKRKGKYVIDISSSKEYNELERDLRSLYDKTNDIVDEISSSNYNNKNDIKIDKKEQKLKDKLLRKEEKYKKRKEKKIIKKEKLNEERKKNYKNVDDSEQIKEKKTLLDYISQKVLNVFIAILSVIFSILLIGVIAFIIYVSTV